MNTEDRETLLVFQLREQLAKALARLMDSDDTNVVEVRANGRHLEFVAVDYDAADKIADLRADVQIAEGRASRAEEERDRLREQLDKIKEAARP